MQVFIHLPDNSIATRLDLGIIEVDFQTMWSVITVFAFNDVGDKVATWKFDHKLESFPVPDDAGQWAIALPQIEQMQQAGQ